MSKKLRGKYQKQRQFGWLISGVIMAVCIYQYLKAGDISIYAPAAAGCLVILALIRPSVLTYPLFIWDKLGYYLALVNTVLLLSGIYFLIFVPLSFFFRLANRDLLGTRLDKARISYWETRPKDAGLFKQQF